MTPSLYKLVEGVLSKAVYLPVGTPYPVMPSEGKRVSNTGQKGRGLDVVMGMCSF